MKRMTTSSVTLAMASPLLGVCATSFIEADCSGGTIVVRFQLGLGIVGIKIPSSAKRTQETYLEGADQHCVRFGKRARIIEIDSHRIRLGK